MLNKVIDLIPGMQAGAGFFSAFIDPVWADCFPTTAGLDMFFASTYGGKWAAPFLEMFVDDDTGIIEPDDVNAIASIIYNMRGA